VEYITDTGEQLSSINESLDSSGSEEGSENEKKAKEALKTKEAKLKLEYELLDDNSIIGPSQVPAKKPIPTSTFVSSTMPLPFISGFSNQRTAIDMYATMQAPISSFYNQFEVTPNYSDCSLENENLSEE